MPTDKTLGGKVGSTAASRLAAGTAGSSQDDVSIPALSRQLVQAKMAEADAQRKLRSGTASRLAALLKFGCL